MPALTIVMPVYNERSTLREAIEDVLETEYPVEDYELVVVDDGSTDGSRELLEQNDWPDHVRIIYHHRNAGKGAAVKTGLREARGTWTVTMDADREYSAGDIPRLLEPLLEGGVDATMGVRTFGSHTAYSFWFVIAGKALTVFMNMLYNSWITDMLGAQKAMRTDLFRSLPLRQAGFAVETETVTQLLLRRARIQEIPVRYEARTREAGKKLTALDGLRILGALIRNRVVGVR
jgi:glycosyltransferase involved in cell wall biosynthesis